MYPSLHGYRRGGPKTVWGVPKVVKTGNGYPPPPKVEIIVYQCIPLCTLFIDVGYRVYRGNLSQSTGVIPSFYTSKRGYFDPPGVVKFDLKNTKMGWSKTGPLVVVFWCWREG
jgi:hypothetical protein